MADANGQTPLHKAAFRGFADTARLLIHHRADIHAKSNDNTSILEIAVLSEQTDVLEVLLNFDELTFEER